MSTGTVTLATLKRGQVRKEFYNGEYIEFKRNVPKIVDDDLANDLEELVDTINTEEKQVIEVDVFEIERDVPRSRIDEDEEGQVRVRTRMVRETVPVRKKPKKLRKSGGTGGGFKSRKRVTD